MKANEHSYYAPVADIVYVPEEDSIETIVRRQENRSKAVSLGISISIISLLMVLLAWWTITALKSEQIDLVISATQSEQEANIDKKQFQNSVRHKPSRPSSRPSNAIVAHNSSSISVPSIDGIVSPDIGSSFGNGFGGGGFGDGLGGGLGVPTTMKGRCSTSDRLSRASVRWIDQCFML